MSWMKSLKKYDDSKPDEFFGLEPLTDLTPKELESLHELRKQLEETIYTMEARLGSRLWDDSAQYSWDFLLKIQFDLKNALDKFEKAEMQ